jgi:Leucine-rich repeat (LRR) protein
MKEKLVLVATCAAVVAGAAFLWVTIDSTAERQERQEQQGQPQLTPPKPLSQADIRERFHEIPKRLTAEKFPPPSHSLIVGFELLDSRRDPPTLAKPDGPADTVKVKPEEDIGCGCCLFPVVCESFDDDDFQLIAKLTGLKRVAVSKTHVTNDGPLLLRSQPQLESLDLSSNPLLTDEVVDRIRHLKTLRSLDLSDTALTGEGLSKLAALPHLERLVLAGTQMTDSALYELGDLAHLKELDLSRTEISGTGFARLMSLPTLEVLKLAEAHVTRDGLAKLPLMPSLRVLDLQQTRLTDHPIAALGRCARLEEINLNSTAAGDGTCSSLAPLTNLKIVRAYATSVSDDGLRSLRDQRQLEILDVTHTKVMGPGVQHLANCRNLKYLYAMRDTNSPMLVDAETSKVLLGLRKLHSLHIELSPTEKDPMPSLHLADLPLLRRLEIACPPQTGDIVLSDLPSLTKLTIRPVLRLEDGYYGEDTPMLRPLPKIESIQLTRIGPAEVRHQPAVPDWDKWLKHSVLEVTSVVPDDLQLDDIRELSQLRLTGLVSEATSRAFDTTMIRTLLSLDCAERSSADAALSLVDRFVEGPVDEGGGYGQMLRLRLPRWSSAWSQALRQTESRLNGLHIEAEAVDKTADMNLKGLRNLERLTLAGIDAEQLLVTDLAPSLEYFDLERCVLGTLTVVNGYSPLRCRELTRFEKLTVTTPRLERSYLQLFRTGPNNEHPSDPFTYAPKEVVLNDLGNVESISLDYGFGIRTVAINGQYPTLKYIWYIPKSTRSITHNGRTFSEPWSPGGEWRRSP